MNNISSLPTSSSLESFGPDAGLKIDISKDKTLNTILEGTKSRSPSPLIEVKTSDFEFFTEEELKRDQVITMRRTDSTISMSEVEQTDVVMNVKGLSWYRTAANKKLNNYFKELKKDQLFMLRIKEAKKKNRIQIIKMAVDTFLANTKARLFWKVPMGVKITNTAKTAEHHYNNFRRMKV